MIIEDTRNKKGKHEPKHQYWDGAGIEWLRSSLPFGDYWSAPAVAVDTKQDIYEIAANMCGAMEEKSRFRRECKKARSAGCKLIFLIEDPRYNEIQDLFGQNIHLHNGQVIPGDQVALAMRMHEQRYGVEFWFCDPNESGRVIKEILEP